MSDDSFTTQQCPLLATIDSPADLKKLRVEQLPQVCDELRRFMIHHLAVNPGHFASSMGAVEIVVALHYVFNTPDDRIVWDVGHQAYAHKILTGRRDLFHTNRKLGGLSGFPIPTESEYDTFTAGHASNSISAALGMAVADRLQGNKNRKVVAVIGDASIGGGLAFEGLNNVSNNPNDLLIILNDNDMSIDERVGGLGEYMSHMTTSKGYNNLRYKTYNFLKRHNIINDDRKGLILRFSNSLKSLLTGQQNIFEGLNVRYFGPFDGHDVIKLVKTLRDIKDMRGPRLLHLHTVKGKGYAPAEADPTTWHAPGRYDENTGQLIKESSDNKPPKFQTVMGETLTELAQANERIVAITAAMPGGTSVDIMQKSLPERTFDVGISEGHAVTFAGGLAKEGMHPFCCIYSSFLQRAYDHIIHDVATLRLPVTFCIDRAGLVGEDGVTHHGLFDLAYLRPVPGLTICAPRNEHQLRQMMYTSQLDGQGPWAIRYPRGRGSLTDWRCPLKEIAVGKGECLAKGGNVAVLSIGAIARQVQQALEILKQQGIAAGHYDMIFLKPLDEQLLEDVARNYRAIITVEDGTTVGGLGSAVAEWVASHGINIQVTRLGVQDTFVHQGTPEQLYALCGLDPRSIAETINSLDASC